MIITGRQLRAACALAGIDQIELAKRAKVSIGTVRRMEAFNDSIVGCSAATLDKVIAAIEESVVVFVDHGAQMADVREN
jgi:transcriptional regulator with XRE-family HTH domain